MKNYTDYKRGNAMRLLRAIGDMDGELIERAAPKDAAARASLARRLKWALPVAACLVIAVIAAMRIIPPRRGGVSNAGGGDSASVSTGGKTDAETGGAAGGGDIGAAGDNAACYPAALDRIFGLPTGNYTWDEGDGVAFDRMDTSELRYLMRELDGVNPDFNAAFTLVRVDGVERFNADYGRIGGSEGQIADCGALYDVLGDGITYPLKIKQYLYGGCTNSEQTNLLRVGGVYALPIIKLKNEDFWSVYGDLDCLFEVDDKGLVWSHSRFERLNKYDGMELAYLWNDIVYLYANPILRSRFAEHISHGSDVVTDGGRIAMHYAAPPETEAYEWFGWDAPDRDRFSAEIDANGRITIPAPIQDENAKPTNGFNIFRPVEGMTVEEMYDAIDKIKAFFGNG